MTASVASSRLSDGGKTEGDRHTTISSQKSSSSNRVGVEEIFPHNNYESVCLLPEAAETLQTSLLKGHSCTSKIYSFDANLKTYNESSEAELSAFLSEVDPNENHIVEICCDSASNKTETAKSFFRLEFEDQIRKVQLLPLPLSTSLRRRPGSANTKNSEATGMLVIVISKRNGMSVHSLVLSRNSTLDRFQVEEFVKVSRGTVDDTGPCMEVSLYLDNTRDEEGKAIYARDPILYVALLPCNPDIRSHRIDILACPLVGHKSPLFRYDTRGPTRALKRSLIMTGVGAAKGISISVRQLGGLPFCTLATLFDSEMKIISFPSLDKWSRQVLKPKDISTVPFNPSSTGMPLLVASVPGSIRSTRTSPVTFAVLCQLYEPPDDSREHQSQSMSAPAYKASAKGALASERRPPPQWTSQETRNAVLRARRDLMTNVLNTFHGEGNLPKCLGPPQTFDESSFLTPVSKGTRSSSDSTVWDENFDVKIPSPDTAILDMSGQWMSRSVTDSILSPLAGLDIPGNDDSSLETFRSNETPWAPPINIRPRTSMENQKRSAQIVMVSLSDIPTIDDSANTVATHLHELPSDFPSCFEAVSMKVTQKELIVAATLLSSSQVRVICMPMTRGHLKGNQATLVEMSPVHIKRAQIGWKVNALELETRADGQLRLRVLTSKNSCTDHRPFGLDGLSEHIVNIESTNVSDTISQGGEVSSQSPPPSDQLVVEKLDTIMNTLLRFESNVNERLSLMEERINENSNRLSRLEKSFSSPIEI